MHKLIVAAALIAASAANATLQPRDLNGDGTVDAYFDTAQNVTFTADADLPATLGVVYNPVAPGELPLPVAAQWATSLDLFGVSGWRLPTVQSFRCFDIVCVADSSELSLLPTFTVFRDVQMNSEYWLGSTVQGGFWEGQFTFFGPTFGHGHTDEGSAQLFAWAVHDGDIAPSVPEPATYALLLAGFIALRFASGYSARRPK